MKACGYSFCNIQTHYIISREKGCICMGISRNKKIIIATILGCGLIFSLVIFIGSKAPKNISALALETKQKTEAELKDSDNDGLLDWEETLWGTDPDNPDTDGDGTPDGEEITRGKDPAKAGNDDLFASSSENPTSTESLDTTELFSRQLLSRLLTAKASGQDLPPEGVAYITNEFLKTQFQYTTYESADLTITTDSTAPSIKTYVNALGMILKADANYRNAEQVVFDFAQEADFSVLEELAAVSNSHAEMYRDLLALPVPKGLVAIHLSLINSISATAEDLDTLSKVTKGDPMILAVGLSQYQNNSSSTTSAIAELRGIIETLGITFDVGEPGNILMN